MLLTPPRRESTLTVNDLAVGFEGGRTGDLLVDGVDIELRAGETFALVGETGAGKSLTGWATLGLLPPGLRVARGTVTFEGRNLRNITEHELRAIRGAEIAVIVQDARSALNPMATVGAQLANVYKSHHPAASRKEAWARGEEALREVGIPDVSRRLKAYPHELSGGMAQRVLIALALINDPTVLIADEPTTGLDATTQAQVLELIAEEVAARDLSLWLITHDLDVVRSYADRCAIMYAGEIVEVGPTETIFAAPAHPYSRALVAAAAEGEINATPEGEDEPHPPAATGCKFTLRCPYRIPACSRSRPSLERQDPPSHEVRCFVFGPSVGEEGEPAGEVLNHGSRRT